MAKFVILTKYGRRAKVKGVMIPVFEFPSQAHDFISKNMRRCKSSRVVML